jgi:hypothetical protein
MTQWYDKNKDNNTALTKFAILENIRPENNKDLSVSDEIFLSLPVNFDHKKILKLDGDGIASLLSDCNREILKTFFERFLIWS